MQRMSCGRDQWKLNAHRLDSLNNVTTRSNCQESLLSRTRSSTRVNLEISFFSFFFSLNRVFFFEENLNDNFWTNFFCLKYFPSPKKVPKISACKNKYFSEIFLMIVREVIFYLNKIQMIVLEQLNRLSFLVQSISHLQKNHKKEIRKILESFFFMRFFCWKNSARWEHVKKQNRKRRSKKHRKQLKIEKVFHPKNGDREENQ